MNKYPWIACVSKENYDNFCRIYYESESQRKGKTIVIFGAGIMGLQLRYVLNELGEQKILFCDNDERKWGTEIGDIKVISPKTLSDNGDKIYVFIAMEKSDECVEQLIKMGYYENEAWRKAGICVEEKKLKEFLYGNLAEALVLGDCALTTVSIFEEDKCSIAELLKENKNTKVVSLNGLYMRAYYNLLLWNLNVMKNLKKVIVLLDTSIFQEKYAQLPQVQHFSVMERLVNSLGVIDKESESFLLECKKRENSKGVFMKYSPNRSEMLTEEKLEQERKLHMRLNYLYMFKHETESTEYLKLFVEKCLVAEVEVAFCLLPVNYELGEQYFGNEFYQRYEVIRDSIKQYIESLGGRVLDGSYILNKEMFLSIRSTNEGLVSDGRRLVVKKIWEKNNL